MKFKKKLLMITMAASMLLLSVSAFAAAERIVMNGNEVEIPTEMGQIREIDDRTFVPIRFIMEYLNCTVNYQETNYVTEREGVKTEEVRSTVTMTSLDTGISYFLTIGDNKLFILTASDAQIIQMDTNAFLGDDDRTYVPIRFLAEAIGYTVGWDEASQTVSLDATEDSSVYTPVG